MNENNKQRIAVIGSGAIGSLVGGLLAEAGEDITLIGSESHIEAIQKNGLIINGILGELKIKVKATKKLDFSPDLVFIATKTQDVEKVRREIKPFIKDIPVVMMQNGN